MEIKHAICVQSFRGMQSFHVVAACPTAVPANRACGATQDRAAAAELTALPWECPKVSRVIADFQLGGAYRGRCLHADYVDADQVATLRTLMTGSRWLEQAKSLGQALRTSPRSAGGLLI